MSETIKGYFEAIDCCWKAAALDGDIVASLPPCFVTAVSTILAVVFILPPAAIVEVWSQLRDVNSYTPPGE